LVKLPNDIATISNKYRLFYIPTSPSVELFARIMEWPVGMLKSWNYDILEISLTKMALIPTVGSINLFEPKQFTST